MIVSPPQDLIDDARLSSLSFHLQGGGNRTIVDKLFLPPFSTMILKPIMTIFRTQIIYLTLFYPYSMKYESFDKIFLKKRYFLEFTFIIADAPLAFRGSIFKGVRRDRKISTIYLFETSLKENSNTSSTKKLL